MTLKNLLLGAALTAGALVGMASAASAYVVCNREGDCWHTETRYAPLGVHFEYHPDDWYFHRHWGDSREHFREYHDGRGFWRNGVWITL